MDHKTHIALCCFFLGIVRLLMGIPEPHMMDLRKEGENDILYIPGESITTVSPAPFLEFLRRKSLEGLYESYSSEEDTEESGADKCYADARTYSEEYVEEASHQGRLRRGRRGLGGRSYRPDLPPPFFCVAASWDPAKFPNHWTTFWSRRRRSAAI